MTSTAGPWIRAATLADAPALAIVHVSAWQWAYRGQLPDSFLEGLTATIERRSAWRRAELARPSESRTWVVEQDGQIVGFADTGPSRDEGAPATTGELYAIYLDQAVVGQGVGRALLAHALDDLCRRGYRAATLWVLTSNLRARHFYEAAGWRPDGLTRVEEYPAGARLDEVHYTVVLNHAE